MSSFPASIVNPIVSVDEDESEEITSTKASCDGIRKKITLFLATKEMTQKAFLEEIGGVNSNSFGRFMKLKGSHSGRDNGTFWGAVNFFDRRDKAKKLALKEEKLANKKRGASQISVSTTDAHNPPTKIANTSQISNYFSSTTSTPALVATPIDVKPVCLDLPEDLSVYDDCDEVRTKIAVFIQQIGMNTSKFSKIMGVTPATVSKFLSKKGFNVGAGSTIYPLAYRYFEQIRLSNGQPKSSHRLKSEAKHPGGYELRNAPTHEWVFCG